MAASVKAPSAKGAQQTFSEQSEKYDYLTAAELDLLLKAAKKTRWSDRDWLAIGVRRPGRLHVSFELISKALSSVNYE